MRWSLSAMSATPTSTRTPADSSAYASSSSPCSGLITAHTWPARTVP